MFIEILRLQVYLLFNETIIYANGINVIGGGKANLT